MNDPHSLSSGVLWACVEEGFHVGSRGGDFLGYVDRRPDGSYSAFDARSQPIGAFPTLEEATAAVSTSQPDVGPESASGGQLKGAIR
ncbi:hypothetical protein [Microbacterium sp. W4I20]|uniref:hypothetical protein n=1 Tax=Microbacterium sp. W4I20 TaxID=3042262 RepID=UPI0027831D39|nr:hypothetical protein [Microbacterium sp. W4I20]MDQ0725390.1 hypothetical protein [Microbacterium sp. W4I20]